MQLLNSKRSGIEDRTGKGVATERTVDENLLLPHLPRGYRSTKGAVVEAARPNDQSPAIDRVIYDQTAASPLLYDEAHSIFPIECVCGLVEITMNLDATKLTEDIERMLPIKAMKKRRYLVPVPDSSTKVAPIEQEPFPLEVSSSVCPLILLGVQKRWGNASLTPGGAERRNHIPLR